MVGAGAGMGGNGGIGGNANSTFRDLATKPHVFGTYDSGDDGKAGESCGNINIYNDIIVYAYGGAGGGSAISGNSDSGSGAGGYPAAGIGGGGAGGGGGDHACSAGGYTAGYGEGGILPGVNGKGSTDNGTGNGDNIGIGGGYYTYSTAKSSINDLTYESWFGEGGCWFRLWSSAGNGGTAGSGGTICVSENVTINAYNGDCITNEDYATTFYEYDKNGTQTSTIKMPIYIKNESKQIIPAKIFAQDGIRRAVYCNICYLPNDQKNLYPLISSPIIKNQTNDGNIKNVKILEEQTITSYGQGIGSGAGYIEVSNGTYTIDETMN